MSTTHEMTGLEQQTYSDGFLVLLLTTRRDARSNCIACRALLFDGGRQADAIEHLDLPADLTHETVPDLRSLLRRIMPEPHVLACVGSGWQTLLEQGAVDLVPNCRILDLTPTAATLAELPLRVSEERLAHAYGIPHVVPETEPFSCFEEDLLWAVVKHAGMRGLAWTELLRVATEARKPVSFDQYDFGEATIASLPDAPGVYMMRDAAGHVLYVGKAGSLAARLSDYFRFRSCVPSKLERIRDEIRSFEVRLVGSELEALLVEDQYIDELKPVINVQRAIAPGSSRYHVRPEPVVLCCASSEPRRRELFIFGGRDRAFQLRVMPARPPAATVTRLVAFLNGYAKSFRTHPYLHDWGNVGNEICWRYWSRFRNNLTWFFAGGTAARRRTLLKQALQSAAQHPDSAEFRLEQ